MVDEVWLVVDYDYVVGVFTTKEKAEARREQFLIDEEVDDMFAKQVYVYSIKVE